MQYFWIICGTEKKCNENNFVSEFALYIEFYCKTYRGQQIQMEQDCDISDIDSRNRSLLTNDSCSHCNSSGSNSLQEWQSAEYLINNINTFGIPVIIALGFLGNTASFFVFVRTKLRNQSSYVYLAFLNVVDTLFLVSLGLGVWLGWIRVYLIHRPGWCQGIIYLTYVSSFLSAWTVVAFTVERYIVVFHPLRRRFCTRARAIKIVVGMTFGALVVYSFAIWTNEVHYVEHQRTHACMTKGPYMNLVQVLVNVDSIVTLLIPSAAIIIFNVAIGIKVWQFASRRKKHMRNTSTRKNSRRQLINMQNSKAVLGENILYTGGTKTTLSPSSTPTPSTSNSSFNIRPIRDKKRVSGIWHNMQIHTTCSLLVVSSVFLLLNLPSHVFRAYVYVTMTTVTQHEFTMEFYFWQHVSQMLSYCNFSVNFFLYCAFNRQFRSNLLQMIRNKTFL